MFSLLANTGTFTVIKISIMCKVSEEKKKNKKQPLFVFLCTFRSPGSIFLIKMSNKILPVLCVLGWSSYSKPATHI